ncbi:MAG: tetratricopeptide repeat protein [Acidimicrobiales bacterium]
MSGPRHPLEEERDRWLRALDALDAEYEAGEIDDLDYTALRDDYTARAADTLRRLDEPGPDGVGGGRAGPSRPVRWFLVAAGLLVFSVAAGLVLAQTLGERGVNDQLTGGIDESPRDKVLRCQQLGAGGGDLVGSLQCFDEVLDDDPDNAEALAYRGWYLVLAGGALQRSVGIEDEDALELLASGLRYLDRAIDADPTYPDPLAFRATINDRLGEADRACADVAALLALDPPEFFVEQTAAIVERNAC